MRENTYYVYIVTNKRRGTLYTGFSNDVQRRAHEHKKEVNDGFTKRYHLHRLVYYELFNDVWQAIAREKAIKKWNRAWKIRLIEKHNPEWRDLLGKDGFVCSFPLP
jgi:putative endonuclease